MAASVYASIAAGSSNNSTFTTGAVNTAAQSCSAIAVAVICNGTEPVLTDSAGNTWTSMPSTTNGSNVLLRWYYCYSPATSATHTFTLTGTGFFGVVAAFAMAGTATSGTPASSAGGTVATATTVQPGSLTPPANGYVILTGLDCAAGTAIAIGGGFTAVTQNSVAGIHQGGGGAYLAQATAAAVNPSWTWTTAANAASNAIAFAPSGSPSLGVSPTSATAVDGVSTVSITPTLTGSSASLTASVSGGGTISTTTPTSGVAITYTPPASGSGTATVTVADATDSLTATCTITYSPISLVVSPATATAVDGVSTVSITPTLTGSSAALTAALTGSGTISTTTPTSGTPFTYTPPASGSGTATVTVADATDSLTATCTVTYSAVATTYTLTAPSPSVGIVGAASGNFTATPNASWTGSVTLTPSGGGLSAGDAVTLTWAASAAAKTAAFTPTALGAVVATPTNTGGLVDPPYAAFVAQKKVNVVFKGDSLTYSQNASSGAGTMGGTSYPGQVVTILEGGTAGLLWTAANLGVQGQAIGDPTMAGTMAATAASTVDTHLVAGALNVLVFAGGTNDISGFGFAPAAPATVYARITAFCAARRSAGWDRIIFGTVTAGQGATGNFGLGSALYFNPLRDELNDLVRANWPTFADGLVDWAADSRIGWDGAQTNTTYFSGDQVHQTDAGYAIRAQYAAPVIQAIVMNQSVGGGISRTTWTPPQQTWHA